MSQKTLEYLIAQGLVRTVPGNSDYIIINSFTNPLSNSYTASETSEYAIKISDFFAAIAASTTADEVEYDNTGSGLTANNVQEAIDELVAIPVDSRPYKSYVAQLTQTGTNNPVVTVIENTLGGTITWTRTGIGSFIGAFSGTMPPANKTFTNGVIFPFENNLEAIMSLTHNGSDFFLGPYTAAGVSTDEFKANIEIRVYN